MQNIKLKCSVKSGQIVAHNNTQVFLHNNQRTNCSRRVCFINKKNDVNYGVWHVYKPLFGSSVATCRLVCSKISPSINDNKQERSPGDGRTWYNLADGVTAIAQLYALYSERARSFNQ